MKTALTDPVHRGMRTDYIASRGERHRKPKIGFFLLPKKPEITGPNVYPFAKWHDYYNSFGVHASKPSTGLQAVFAVMEFLKPKALALVGFDWVLHPETCVNNVTPHDFRSGCAAVHGLGIPIIDLAQERSWPT